MTGERSLLTHHCRLDRYRVHRIHDVRLPVKPLDHTISLLLPPIEREIPSWLLVREATSLDPLTLFQLMVAPVMGHSHAGMYH